MATIEELVVEARPEGLSETTEGLEDMEEQFDSTAESMSDTTDSMEGMQQRMQGAMGAIVTGVAVAAGGLLSTVPVVGEVVSGLGAVVTALGFKMDQVLRPALSGVTDRLYGIADAIMNASGPFGNLIGWGATAAAVIGGLAASALAVGTIFGGGFAATLGTVSGLLGTVASAIAGVISVLAGLISLPALIIGALVAMVVAWVANVGGIRDKTIEMFTNLISWIQTQDWKQLGRDVMQFIIDGLKTLVVLLLGVAGTIVSTLWDTITNTDWVQLGKDTVTALIKGIELLAAIGNALGQAAGGMGEVIIESFQPFIDDAVQWGKDIIQNIIKGIEAKVDDLRAWLNDLQNIRVDFGPSGNLQISGLGTPTGGGGGGGGGSSPFMSRRDYNVRVNLDGREVTRGTDTYRDDPTSRRGRYG